VLSPCSRHRCERAMLDPQAEAERGSLLGEGPGQVTQGAALPGPLAALQEGDLIGRDGSHVALRSIGRKKLVAVYFGAGWCPPCRQFSPILSGIAHRTAEDLAVIFVSADRSEQEMQAFVQGKHFASVSFSSAARRQIMADMGVSMYPSLIILDGQTGKVLTRWGRMMLHMRGEEVISRDWLRGESGERRYIMMAGLGCAMCTLVVLWVLGFVSH
jgi:nucleoredoxin